MALSGLVGCSLDMLLDGLIDRCVVLEGMDGQESVLKRDVRRARGVGRGCSIVTTSSCGGFYERRRQRMGHLDHTGGMGRSPGTRSSRKIVGG
jgi:hypothetical protein